MFMVRLGYELHLSLTISLKSVRLHAAIAEPKELRALFGGSSEKFKQLAVTEITEFFRTVGIVTLGNHR